MPTTNVSPAEERRAADRDRIEHAARALLTSEGWQRWVQVRSRNGLARYSFGNQLLIALQNPDATYVAGFRAFLDLGRCVRKGEKGIRIHAPMPPRKKEHDEDGRQPVRFRSIAVFDVSQTDPLPGTEPVALEPPAAPITGDSHAHLLPKLEALASELGYRVSFEAITGSREGSCDSRRRIITVDAALAANAQVRVLVHELAHAQRIDYTTYTREHAEVIVDTATIMVCGSAGLDVTGHAIPYIAGWGEDGALDAVRGFAAEIDRVARRIEGAIGGSAGRVRILAVDGEERGLAMPVRVEPTVLQGSPAPSVDRDMIRAALEGDSNDAEHDALVDVARVLGIDFSVPADRDLSS